MAESAENRMLIRHEVISDLPPEAFWDRLTSPSLWWQDAHTYSGSAGNLTLEPQAGGLWREDWAGGSVAHGRVLLLIEGRQMRLEAPFGPLQGMAVNAVWTLTLDPSEDGTRLTSELLVSGSEGSGLDGLAAPVDGVIGEALQALAAAD